MRAVGSYFEMTPSMYRPPPAGTADWELAPVPGWGANPLRSGPPVLATGLWPNENRVPMENTISNWAALGDSEEYANQGYMALAAFGGIALGWFMCWAFHASKKSSYKANRKKGRSSGRRRKAARRDEEPSIFESPEWKAKRRKAYFGK